MDTTCLYLGELGARSNAGELNLFVVQDFTDLAEYSRFKFGDSSVGRKYGNMLGGLVLNEAADLLVSDQIFVASSAYRTAPPASQCLISPFIEAARSAASSANSRPTFTHFKISKRTLAHNNYAALSFKERSRTLQSDLTLPEDLSLKGQRVIILDDIRVTGLREAALRMLLEAEAVEHVSFYYVLNVPQGGILPQAEALINMRSVKSIDDIIGLAMEPGFIPNIRLCKFLLALGEQSRERFFATVPKAAVDLVLHYIKADNLEDVVKAVP